MAPMEVNVNVQDLDVFKNLAKRYKTVRTLVVLLTIACLVESLLIVQAYVELGKMGCQLRISQAETEAALEDATRARSIARYVLDRYKKSVAVTEEPCHEVSSTKITTSEPDGHWLTVTATAYCPCVKCCGIYSQEHPSRINTGYVQKTSSGTIPTQGRTIAVDTKVIPMGSRVLIGDNIYIAEDTGSGVCGNHVDIFFASHSDALKWGKQTVEVYVYED